jgi:hypothetical protein
MAFASVIALHIQGRDDDAWDVLDAVLLGINADVNYVETLRMEE